MKVLLVDDHPVTRHGVRALVSQQPNLEVCGEAADGRHAVEMAERLRPDLAVVDIELDSDSGLDLTKALVALGVPVLVLSMYDEAIFAERALKAGARGYLMKQEAGDKLVTAIGRTLQGDLYVSDRMKQRMLRPIGRSRMAETTYSLDLLSEREWEVFRQIADGFSTREIAQKLGLSTKTIDSYREHLKEKLNLKSGTELMRYAVQWAREPVESNARGPWSSVREGPE